MKVTFGYQYADFDPDKILKHDGLVDLDKAIHLFHNYPWEKQFEIISKRLDSNISSSYPTIYFYKSETHFLSISASSEQGFLIHYQMDNKFGELFISNDILERPQGISVETIINDFLCDKLQDFLELTDYDIKPTETVHFELRYSKVKIYRPLLWTLAPFIYLLFDYDPIQIIPVILIMSGIIFIATIPRVHLNYTYWKNDFGQQMTYNPNNRTLMIDQKGKKTEISKTLIKSCDYVHTRPLQRAFKEFSYLRIKTENDTFIVTHLTTNTEELLNLLSINFNDIEVFYPKIDFKIESEKERKKRIDFYEKKRAEFLKTYVNWETKRLEEVISKTDQYADYAISAALEILESRKKTN